MTSVALVAGGAGDIGRGIVDALLREGRSVAVLDLRVNERASLSVECDLTDADAVQASVAQIVRRLGEPGQVVCAAGAVSRAPVVDLSPAEWQRVVDISLTSTFLVTRAVIPAMRSLGGGAIVTLSSGLARRGYAFGAPYASAKAGVEALTKSIALEYAGDGVRCNCVAPGPIRSTMTDGNANFDEQRALGDTPMGRLGTVADVVAPVMFLLGDGASYITGQVLQVNGGLLMP